MKFHPDRTGNDKSAETKFKEAKEAYDVLSDPQKKSMYDQYGTTDFGGGFGGGFGGRSQGVLMLLDLKMFSRISLEIFLVVVEQETQIEHIKVLI